MWRSRLCKVVVSMPLLLGIGALVARHNFCAWLRTRTAVIGVSVERVDVRCTPILSGSSVKARAQSTWRPSRTPVPRAWSCRRRGNYVEPVLGQACWSATTSDFAHLQARTLHKCDIYIMADCCLLPDSAPLLGSVRRHVPRRSFSRSSIASVRSNLRSRCVS
jgi:hypothetical protein